MLLNTFRTCLCNLFNSDYENNSIKAEIGTYISNGNLLESTYNPGAINYFEKEYLDAIRKKDINYLFNMGKQLHTKNRPKKAIKNALQKIPFI